MAAGALPLNFVEVSVFAALATGASGAFVGPASAGAAAATVVVGPVVVTGI